MFEHYLHHHTPDPRRRLRLAIAVNLAAFGVTGALAFTWLMGKLHIAQVAAPTSNYVLVQMSLDTPPPPPMAPAAPAVKTEPETRDEPDDDPTVPPEDIVEQIAPPKPRVAKPVLGQGPPTATGTNPIGNVPGTGIGVPGLGRVPGIPFGTGVAQKQTTDDGASKRPPVPFSAVRAQAIFTPEPAQARLLATRSGMFTKVGGENETTFCIDATGKATDVRTTKPFPGDPGVDAICRDTVKTWRFKPFMVEGKAIKTCVKQVFRITFR